MAFEILLQLLNQKIALVTFPSLNLLVGVVDRYLAVRKIGLRSVQVFL